MRKWHVRIDKKRIFCRMPSCLMVAAISEMKIFIGKRKSTFFSPVSAAVLALVGLYVKLTLSRVDFVETPLVQSEKHLKVTNQQ